MTPEELRQEVENLLKAGKSQEDVISFLRQKGCSKTMSIFILSSVLKLGGGEAKRIVHFSKTWADTRKSDDQFHKRIERIVENDS
jgi:IS30 family transposase